MKSFIVAALLVAAVAGQSLDMVNLHKEFNPLMKFDRALTTKDLVLKKLLGHPMERDLIYGENVQIPAYLRDDILDVTVLRLEEVISHPLFQQYMTLPLFRQYFEYPAFQKYVASVYFQRFWQIPTFKQYFVNPVLFYKYVYPLVNLFKYDTVSPVTGDYVWNKNVLPYQYYGQQYGQEYNQEIYRIILNKIYNHVYQGQQGRLQNILTDVQLTPEGKVREQTYGKIVDPITGHVKLSLGDVKILDEQVIPVEHGIDTVLPEMQYKREYVPEIFRQREYVPQIYQGEYRHFNYNPLVQRFAHRGIWNQWNMNGRVQYPFVYNRL